MAIDFSTGSSTYFTKPPRTVITYDTLSGCPPTRAVNVPIASTSIVLTAPAALVVNGKLIRNNGINSGQRGDLSLYVSTGQVCRSLDFVDAASNWQQAVVAWMGTLSAGTHSIYMYSDNLADAWGCTGYWGHVQIMIFE
jgi:hypothetical protein